MTAKMWRIRIREQLSDLSQNPKAYRPAINTLADILEQRDKIYTQYVEEGCHAVREYTNKAGATNLTKNPLLVLWDDLNKSALAYWRELGLTPSSYKKVSGDGPTKEKASGLAAALMQLETD